MIQNRTIPFGYKKEMGEVIIYEIESEIVKQIYTSYANGCSYKRIAESLTNQGIKYMKDRDKWNKNMIARILQNEKYLGNDEYPQIIENALHLESTSAKKPYTHTQSKVIKLVKPLLVCEKCGCKLNRRLSPNGSIRWYCENDLSHISLKLTDEDLEHQILEFIFTKFEHYKFIQKLSPVTSLRVIELENELTKLLSQSELDVENIHKKIIQLAQEKYLLLENTLHLKEHILSEIITTKNLKNIGEIVVNFQISDDNVLSATLVDTGVIHNERNSNNTCNG
ncbi:MAG: recombinase family protein [Clostridia bacterium]